MTATDFPDSNYASLRDTAAMLLANGASTAEVASQVGRSPLTIRDWLRDAEFQEMVRAYRERVLLAANRTLTLFLLESERVARNMISMAQDNSHTRHYDACKYVLDKLMPEKRVHEVKSTHTLPDAVNDVLGQLSENLRQLREHRGGEVLTPKTLNGKEAIEAYGIGEDVEGTTV